MTYRLSAYLAYTRKALINVMGIAGVLLAEGLVPKPYDHYVSVGIAVVAAAIHYAAPNSAKPGSAAALDNPDDGAEDDAYVPTGPSEADLDSVDATPPPAAPLTIPTTATSPTVPADTAVDALRMIASMLEVYLRAVQSGVASTPVARRPDVEREAAIAR